MKTALAIIPHADDAAFFCAATLAKRAAEGWRVIIARVTDDKRDSVGLGEEETIIRNREELHEVADILGAHEVVDLGFTAESLADVSEVELRGRFVYLIRKYQPYAVFTFDPHGLYETNLDHIRTAQAVEEAFWMARFDIPYREHFEEGLTPFAVCEQWYYARQLPEQNHVEDVTDYIDKKIEAACAHRTMIANIMNQCRLMLESYDGPVPEGAAQAFEGDYRPLVASLLKGQAQAIAAAAGLEESKAAEVFRVQRFGDLAGIFEALGIS